MANKAENLVLQAKNNTHGKVMPSPRKSPYYKFNSRCPLHFAS